MRPGQNVHGPAEGRRDMRVPILAGIWGIACGEPAVTWKEDIAGQGGIVLGDCFEEVPRSLLELFGVRRKGDVVWRRSGFDRAYRPTLADSRRAALGRCVVAGALQWRPASGEQASQHGCT